MQMQQTSDRAARGSRRGRLVWVCAVMVATLLGTGSPAWAAHSVTQGTTYYANGSPQEGPYGTAVTIYATGAVPNTIFNIATGDPGPSAGPCGDNITFAQPVVNYTSDANGNIANATATIDRYPGTYNVCFYEQVTVAEAGDTSKTVTAPVLFTVEESDSSDPCEPYDQQPVTTC